MKKGLIFLAFFIVINISLTGCGKDNLKNNTTASENINTIHIFDYVNSFKYGGKQFLYSKMDFIQSENYTYFILDKHKKEISITKILNAKGKLTIPNRLDGFKVVCVGVPLNNFAAYEEGEYVPESQYCILDKKDVNNVTSLFISEDIKNIGIGAFINMTRLKQVLLPDSLECIGINAFANTGIEDLVLPVNLKSVRMSSFYGCNYLKKVTVNSKNVLFENEYPAFKGCDSLKEVAWGNVENVDMGGFRLNDLERVVMPSTMKK